MVEAQIAGTKMNVDQIDFAQLQGFVPKPYRYPLSRYHLFKFSDDVLDRSPNRFLSKVAPQIVTAQVDLSEKPEPLFNIMFTANGLKRLAVTETILNQFESAFLRGPEGIDDKIALGDFGSSSSENWWGRKFSTSSIHGIIQVTAKTDQGLVDGSSRLHDLMKQFNVEELFTNSEKSPLEARSLGGGRLHFGYTDGISHPDVRWGDDENLSGSVDFRHFLLGYSREPLLSSPVNGQAADLAKGSSYAVFRIMAQDSAKFEKFLDENFHLIIHLVPEGIDPREFLAAKMLGRWRDGTPIVLSPERSDETLNRSNNFNYSDDREGLRCPFSAHIRVVNPRDQILETRIAGPPPMSFGPVPKVLRRGLPYGPEWKTGQNDNADRGLMGLFICSSISQQMYTMTRWMKRNDFSPVFKGRTRSQDAIFANRNVPEALTDFVIQTENGEISLPSLQNFVETRGTVFLLVPSIHTLNALTK
jgi:Dyp-type peroxidase family